MIESATLRRYADHLARQLIGPCWRRSEIVDEVMDGLLCAADDHLVTCSDPADAARRAVEEWGAPGEVARAYNDATLRLVAKRLSWQTMCVLPLLMASWGVVLLACPAPWPQHPPILVFAVSVVWLGAALCLLGALVGLRRGAGVRAAVAHRADTATTGALAALIGLILVLSAVVILLLNRSLTHPESLNWWLVPVPAAMTLLAGAYFGTSLRRLVFMRVAVR